ncbi:MAG: DUF4317 domain-containing protein [Lachnospiraceae bacterium]|nr:DUF4317 domain-containing protein [Lachnospiraceae bacterium]
MNKKEVAEIKRRLKKESCTISKMVGCYVNSSKDKVCTFSESFLSLEDEEFHKYLEIANKTLSGTVGNNLIELEFPIEAEENGAPQQNLMALKKSGLEDENLYNAFFDHIIETYDFVGNYLILLYYDNYDVMVKTSDNMKLDESEETYEYIICSICPVMLSKPGLGYREDEHRIGARIRDWVVGPTDSGFIFPCFTDRSSDIHSIMMYTKKADDPHKELWEMGLGCASKLTTQEKKNAFTNILTQTIGPDKEDTSDIIVDIQANLSEYIEEKKEVVGKDDDIMLDSEVVEEILKDVPISEEKTEKITKNYEEFFKEALPEAEEILDTKVLKNNELRLEKKSLQERVADLTSQLKESGVIGEDGKENDIIVKVNPEKIEQISTTFLDGKKCIIIPVEDGEKATINGEKQDV